MTMVSRRTTMYFVVQVLLAAAVAGQLACPGSDLLRRTRQYILNTHNSLRSRIVKNTSSSLLHGSNVYALSYNCTLERQAQSVADKCQNERSPASERPGAGENFYRNVGRKRTEVLFAKAITNWWSEFVQNSTVLIADARTSTIWESGFNSFAQIAWGPAIRVGCGWKHCGEFTQIVCQYMPKGPKVGEEVVEPGLGCTTDSQCTTFANSTCDRSTQLCLAPLDSNPVYWGKLSSTGAPETTEATTSQNIFPTIALETSDGAPMTAANSSDSFQSQSAVPPIVTSTMANMSRALNDVAVHGVQAESLSDTVKAKTTTPDSDGSSSSVPAKTSTLRNPKSTTHTSPITMTSRDPFDCAHGTLDSHTRHYVTMCHNIIRSYVSRGETNVGLQGRNIYALSYDCALESQADRAASKCLNERSPVDERYGAGENFFHYTGGYPIMHALATSLTRWWNQAIIQNWSVPANNVYTSEMADGSIDMFAQVVWGSTTRFGCGSAQCHGFMQIVCQYMARGPNVGEAIVQPGIGCRTDSECTTFANSTCDVAKQLCVSPPENHHVRATTSGSTAAVPVSTNATFNLHPLTTTAPLSISSTRDRME